MLYTKQVFVLQKLEWKKDKIQNWNKNNAKINGGGK